SRVVGEAPHDDRELGQDVGADLLGVALPEPGPHAPGGDHRLVEREEFPPGCVVAGIPDRLQELWARREGLGECHVPLTRPADRNSVRGWNCTAPLSFIIGYDRERKVLRKKHRKYPACVFPEQMLAAHSRAGPLTAEAVHEVVRPRRIHFGETSRTPRTQGPSGAQHETDRRTD